MVPHRGKKDLRLVLQPPKRIAVNNAIPVPLIGRSKIIVRLRPHAAFGIRNSHGIRREKQILITFGFFTNGGHGQVSFLHFLKIEPFGMRS